MHTNTSTVMEDVSIGLNNLRLSAKSTGLLALPSELLRVIFSDFITCIGIVEAWHARRTCSTFWNYIAALMIEDVDPEQFDAKRRTRKGNFLMEQTRKEKLTLNSILNYILPQFLRYRMSTPAHSQLPICRLINGLLDNITQAEASSVVHSGDSRSAYTEDLLTYLEGPGKHSCRNLIVGKTLAVTSLTQPINTLSTAAAIGNIAVIKAPGKSTASGGFHDLVCYPGALYTKDPFLRDPVLAAASTRKVEMVAFLLRTMDSWGTRKELKLTSRFSATHLRAMIYRASNAAVLAGHHNVVSTIVDFIIESKQRHHNQIKAPEKSNARSFMAVVARSGCFRMFAIIRKMYNKITFNKEDVKIACYHGRTELLHNLLEHNFLDPESRRGFLRYAVKTGRYSATEFMLELGLTSNNDGLIQLAMCSGDAHMLKLLVDHNIKVTPTHAKLAQKTLVIMDFRYNSLEHYFDRQDTVWCGREWVKQGKLYYTLTQPESVSSCVKRRELLVTLALVFKFPKAARPKWNWKWDWPLLVKLEKQFEEDDFWEMEIRKLEAGTSGS